MKKEEVDAHVRSVVDKLIAQMQENQGEWIAPWHNGFLEPKNAITHHLFSGMNAGQDHELYLDMTAVWLPLMEKD